MLIGPSVHHSGAGTSPSKQGVQCRPWERSDLFRRLHTFKPYSWFCKPKVAGPMACASRGWINIGMDLIECEVRNVTSRGDHVPHVFCAIVSVCFAWLPIAERGSSSLYVVCDPTIANLLTCEPSRTWGERGQVMLCYTCNNTPP
jgi:hypothetical protein